MIVENIMSKTVVTVDMDDPISLVKEIFENTCFHHLLVVESGILQGIISDRDLLKALSPNLGTVAETRRDKETLNKRAHQIMTRKPITLKPSATMSSAIKLFNSHTISCIPIINSKHEVEGIVSWRDIFKVL